MSKAPTIKPDFDTDVLWKPPRLSHKERTVSTDSTDSDVMRKMSDVAGASGPSVIPRSRRLSFTEMILGSPTGGFSWGQAHSQVSGNLPQGEMERRMSVTEDARFKELIKHQSKILGEQ